MGVRRVALLTACTASLALPARAETPLSVIDWLGEAVSEPDAPSAPVAESANQPEISVAPLETSQAAIGLVPADVTGLPVDLWRGSDPRRLERLIETAPVEQHPPLQALLYSLLLTEALPPASSAADKDRVLLARIDRLMDLGVLEPAKALIEVAGPARSPALFQRWSDASFLAGTEDDVCAALDDARHLAPNRQTLIFCIARRGAPQEATPLKYSSMKG